MKRRDFLKSASAGALPAVSATAARGGAGQSAAAQFSSAENRYYRFPADGRECIVLRPDTPIPWMNLLSNDDFQTWITHRGGIEVFMLDRGLAGLTNPQETSGFVYVRDRSDGSYFLINRPKRGARWSSNIGQGFTAVTCSDHGLTARTTYFIPRADNVLVWLVSLRNEGPAAREIDLFSTVEFNLGDQNKRMVFDGHGGGGDAYTGASQFNLYKRVHRSGNALYAEQPVWRSLGLNAKPWPFTGFFASSLPLESFDCLRSDFLGPAGNILNPIALERGVCSNHEFWSLNDFPWGVLHNRLHLGAGAEQTVVVALGMARDKAAAAKVISRYSSVETAHKEFERVKSFWDQFLAKTPTVETPAPEFDRNINIWDKYQWRSSMLRSQNTGYRSIGFWSYGLMTGKIGTSIREVTIQPNDVDIAREAVLTYLSGNYSDYKAHMFSESQPLLLFEDLDMTWPAPKSGGLKLPHAHEFDNTHAICMYLKETGDLGFLDRRVPYVDGGEGTVFEHLSNCVANALLGLSPRGLPLLNKGIGDWNDELNMVSREGQGESVMFAMTICFNLRECAEIAEASGRRAEAKSWMESYERIKSAINTLAWDGEWYIRAFADGASEPMPIGSSKEKEGRIHLETQVWSVLGGIAEGERIRKCMESVDKHLMSPYGPRIYAPSYSKFNEHVGIASAYAPGWRNGCIYLRPVGWAVMAACVANRPEQAFRMYESAALARVSRDMERFQHEPYVYPENYVGPEHRFAGRGQYQWCLGEGANWMWHSYVSYILGVRPLLKGLLVDPKIPSRWKGFKVKREFRGARYEIEVSNPKGAGMGVGSLLVDGREVAGNIVPAHGDGRTHHVKVELG